MNSSVNLKILLTGLLKPVNYGKKSVVDNIGPWGRRRKKNYNTGYPISAQDSVSKIIFGSIETYWCVTVGCSSEDKFLATNYEFGGSFRMSLWWDCHEVEVTPNLEFLVTFGMSLEGVCHEICS